MNLYLIGGLGADKRVFKYLNLDCNSVVIEWIEVDSGTSIQAYVKRLAQQIDTSKPFGILGVSFGGIIAIEMCEFLSPEFLILISSVETSRQLPKAFSLLGRMSILKAIPKAWVKPPNFIMHYLFGAVNKKLLGQIIADTDPNFIKWALHKVFSWQHDAISQTVIRIHGTKDKLIPLKGDAIKIENGGHFMVVDKANEISDLINANIPYKL